MLFPLLSIPGDTLEWAVDTTSTIPSIGSSGSIAFLMGAYLFLFRSAKLRFIIFMFPMPSIRFWAPAWIYLLYWAAPQFFSANAAAETRDGIAYAAHVGSFVGGVLCVISWKLWCSEDDRAFDAFLSGSSLFRVEFR